MILIHAMLYLYTVKADWISGGQDYMIPNH
jgi:hypothetical protein